MKLNDQIIIRLALLIILIANNFYQRSFGDREISHQHGPVKFITYDKKFFSLDSK